MHVCIYTACLSLYYFCLQQYQNARHKKELWIGMALYDENDKMILDLAERFQKEIKQIEARKKVPVHITIVDAKEDQLLQDVQIEHFFALHYDVVCANLVNRAEAANIIDMAREAKTPMIFFNREPVHADKMRWKQVYYVGGDGKKEGILQGKMVVDFYQRQKNMFQKHKIQYVLLEGETRHQDAALRTKWAIQTIQKAGIQLEKLAAQSANWKKDEAYHIMRQWREQFGDKIQLVLCNNDAMALGAYEALEESGNSTIPIFGIDGTQEGKCAVDQQKLAGTVAIDRQIYAEALAHLSDLLANQQTFDQKEIRVPAFIYTK